jgi:hypothetical protein
VTFWDRFCLSVLPCVNVKKNRRGNVLAPSVFIPILLLCYSLLLSHYVPHARALSILASFTLCRVCTQPLRALAPNTPNTEQAHLNISFICIITAFYLSLLWSSNYIGTHTSIPVLLTFIPWSRGSSCSLANTRPRSGLHPQDLWSPQLCPSLV